MMSRLLTPVKRRIVEATVKIRGERGEEYRDMLAWLGGLRPGGDEPRAAAAGYGTAAAGASGASSSGTSRGPSVFGGGPTRAARTASSSCGSGRPL